MNGDEQTDAPFIFFPDGNRTTHREIQILAGKLHALQKQDGAKPDRPVAFFAGDVRASALVAACWTAGIPYWVLPGLITVFQENAISRIRPFITIAEKKTVETVNIPGKIITPAALEKITPVFWDDEINADQIFSYVMTSGTSGTPKVVALKRAQMLYAAEAAGKNIKPDSGRSWMLILPLNHIGGASVVLRSLIYGCRIMDFRMSDLSQIADTLGRDKSVSMVSMVPTQLRKWLDSNPKNTVHPEFQAVLLGGGPSDENLIKEARKRGVPVMKSYGMTETCAQVCSVPADEIMTADENSSGVVLSGNEIEIRDENGSVMPPETAGLIWVRGPQVIKSYVFPKTANRAFGKDSWYCTGDYGHLDSGGNLFVHMRRDDLIISGGENVNPVELEAEILKLPAIEDAAVKGIKDDYWGEKVVAFVVCEERFFQPESWKSSLKKILPSYKVPAEFYRVNRIPRTETGKIKRRELVLKNPV